MNALAAIAAAVWLAGAPAKDPDAEIVENLELLERLELLDHLEVLEPAPSGAPVEPPPGPPPEPPPASQEKPPAT